MATEDENDALHSAGVEEEVEEDFLFSEDFFGNMANNIDLKLPRADDWGFDTDELSTAIKVVRALHLRPELLKSKPLKEFRSVLNPLLDDRKDRYFGGGRPSKYENKVRRKRMHQSMNARLTSHDRNYMNTSKLRKERLAALEKLKNEGPVRRALIKPTLHSSLFYTYFVVFSLSGAGPSSYP